MFCIALPVLADVTGEDAILEWHKRSHSAKGKAAFLSQMTKFVTWLQTAEAESDGE